MRSDRQRLLDILVHHYFDVDADIVWSVVEKDLPDLKANLLEILDQGES